MKKIFFKQARHRAQLIAVTALVGLLTYGLVVRAAKAPEPQRAIRPLGGLQQGPIQVRPRLSQHKVVRGSDGLLYLQLDMEAPHQEMATEQRPLTDFVVVLDRSSSMSGAKKMDYALQAVKSLIGQMKGQDRLALVTFDNEIETVAPLTNLGAAKKAEILQKVATITPRGSTNLGGGLIRPLRGLGYAS